MKRFLLILSGTMALAGFALAAEAPSPNPDPDYIIGPEDKLKITVLKHPEYDRETLVLQDGTIVYPIPEGEIQVAGLTRAQVQAIVVEKLKFDLRAPQVIVEITQQRPRPVYVTGKLPAPQTLELQRGWRVSEALAKTGGLGTKPELLRATLRRASGEQIALDLKAIMVSSDSPANMLLQPGDHLDIQDIPVNKIYFLGQVNAPGPQEIQEGLGIIQAITQAGGVNAKAALSRVLVVRGDQTTTLDLRPLLQEGRVPDSDFKLQAGDVVVVPEHIAKAVVLGNVRAPGYIDLPEGERVTVTGAVHRAGGYLDKSKLSEVVLIRGDDVNKAQRTKVDMNAVIRKGQLAKDPVVQPNDIVYVPKSGKVEPFEGLWLLQGVDWVLKFFGLGF